VPAGRWRGGIGSVREFAFLDNGGFSIEGDGHKYRPWGYDGGHDGRTASITLVSDNRAAKELVSKVSYLKARPGDRLICLGPCGGGYGDPLERDPEAVLHDVLEGYLGPGTALEDYGVVLSEAGVDLTATQAERLRRQ